MGLVWLVRRGSVLRCLVQRLWSAVAVSCSKGYRGSEVCDVVARVRVGYIGAANTRSVCVCLVQPSPVPCCRRGYVACVVFSPVFLENWPALFGFRSALGTRLVGEPHRGHGWWVNRQTGGIVLGFHRSGQRGSTFRREGTNRFLTSLQRWVETRRHNNSNVRWQIDRHF